SSAACQSVASPTSELGDSNLTRRATGRTINGSHRMVHIRARVCLALLLTGGPGLLRAQEPTLEDVLRRAGAYVADFQRRIAGVVAEETYTQDVLPLSSAGGLRDLTSARGTGHRELKSDLLLVRRAGADRWVR